MTSGNIPLFIKLIRGEKVEEKIRSLIENTIVDAGYILSDVKLEKEGSVLFLRVLIDKPEIVSVEDCVKVSELINPILDKEDPIHGSYVLDVSSIERG